MTYSIYYGIGPTFHSHVLKYGNPQKSDFIFDTFDYTKKIKIGNYSFIVLNLAENIDTNYCRISIL